MPNPKAFIIRFTFDDSGDIEYALAVLKMWCKNLDDKHKKYGFVRQGLHSGILFIATRTPILNLTTSQRLNDLKTLLTTNTEIQIIEHTDPAT